MYNLDNGIIAACQFVESDELENDFQCFEANTSSQSYPLLWKQTTNFTRPTFKKVKDNVNFKLDYLKFYFCIQKGTISSVRFGFQPGGKNIWMIGESVNSKDDNKIFESLFYVSEANYLNYGPSIKLRF